VELKLQGIWEGGGTGKLLEKGENMSLCEVERVRGVSNRFSTKGKEERILGIYLGKGMVEKDSFNYSNDRGEAF